MSGHRQIVIQARDIRGGVNLHADAGVPRPAQLPHAPHRLADRRAERGHFRRLVSARPAAPKLLALTGEAGIGKTALGLHCLHQVAEEYGDGQLYVDLRGTSGHGALEPHDVLPRFLRSLGVAPRHLPADMDEQAGLFRTLTAGRRLIVMLDNAAGDDQLPPLLPGPGPSITLVTSRHRLPGMAMAGAHIIGLGPLDDRGAVDLLAGMLGKNRVTAEARAVRALVERCGRRPLALCVAGASLATRRHPTVAELLCDLQANQRKSDLEDPMPTAPDRVAVATAYIRLGNHGQVTAQRVYRLLGGVHPGHSFTAGDAGALAELLVPEAAHHLNILVQANLLQQIGERYSFHGLVREHAAATCEQVDPASERDEAFGDLLQHKRETAVDAQGTINPDRWYLSPAFHEWTPRAFPDAKHALAWMERERDTLHALMNAAFDRGLWTWVWQLAEAQWGRYVQHRAGRDCVTAHELGLRAAQASGDPLAIARMYEGLAFGRLTLGDPDAAITAARAARRIEEDARHVIGVATASELIGVAHLAAGRPREALNQFEICIDLHRDIERERGAAINIRHCGEAAQAAGDLEQAIEHYQEALTYFRARPHERYMTCRTELKLARPLLSQGRIDDAARITATALTTAKSVDARSEQATAHVLLADVAAHQADRRTEREHLALAIGLYHGVGAVTDAQALKQRLEALPAPPHRGA